MAYIYKCTKCGEELSKLEASSDPSGCGRPDYYCCECDTRYGMTASGLYIVAENRKHSEVLARNAELETTIKIMMELKKDS